MSHSHQHSHSHHHHAPPVLTAASINRSFIIGIVLNLLYVVVELAYGWKADSTALLSDAVHNIGDVSGLVLAFIAFRLQRVKANKTFTYGLRKGSIVASFINSVLLAFAIGAIAWEGVRHIITPSPINGNTVMIVAAMGIIINFSSALLFKKDKSHDLKIKAAYWHLMADALVSLGVVISGLMMKYTGWYFIDGIAAVVVAGVILFSTLSLFKDSLISIMDGVPAGINPDEIKAHLLEIEGVRDVHHIHIWSMSTHENAITCHVLIEQTSDLVSIKKQLKSTLVAHNISHSTLEFEVEEEACHEC
jgi:cobalt-zinc-cadmium efflux system protein